MIRLYRGTPDSSFLSLSLEVIRATLDACLDGWVLGSSSLR